MPRSFLLLLAIAGLGLSASVVPGVFTVDEDNYLMTVLALREGGLSVPGTDALPPSRELFYFDPALRHREASAAPIHPSAPPLYAAIALPFSLLGWRGLVALNTVAFLGTAALLFVYARRYADERAGWIAAAAFGLGGFAIEYSQGVWPHMVSVFLCVAALVLAARVRDGAGPALALAAGLLAGTAAGVRYQNVVVAAGVGVGILVFAPKRLRASAVYASGVGLPLLVCSAINRARLGSWNPISKRATYLKAGVGVDNPHATAPANPIVESLQVLYAKVVDFSTHPAVGASQTLEHGYLQKDPETGAFFLLGAVKKAWLQSSPWVAVGLIVLVGAWFGWRRLELAQGDGRLRRELRALSFVVFPVLGVFAIAGFSRLDGLCFNQRYFHELVPVAAVACAWAFVGRPLERPALLGGALVALVAVVAVTRSLAGTSIEALFLMKAPLALAVALLASWLWVRAGGATGVSVVLGLCLGWGLGVHAVDDLPASRALRTMNRNHRVALADSLPDRSALFAYWGLKDAYGPLQLDRDLVIADVWADDGAAAPELAAAFLAQERRVFVLANGFPPPVISRMARGRSVQRLPLIPVEGSAHPIGLLEITGQSAAGSERALYMAPGAEPERPQSASR